MFSRLRDKHELLNEHIHQLGDIMADALKIEEWNPNNELQSVIYSVLILRNTKW